MPMKVREVISLLQKRGWILMRSRGSHRNFRHPGSPDVITVPGNDGKELNPGILNDILKKRHGSMNAKRYPVIIEPTGTGYCAYSPDVPGCVSAGDTEEETRQNFQEALISHFDAMREIGTPIPEPSSAVAYVEIAA
jgi:predicted RNA binding protein YcfA (HicA-like mRNA interferase family)/predicted RNase H-like HicB family nuclease